MRLHRIDEDLGRKQVSICVKLGRDGGDDRNLQIMTARKASHRPAGATTLSENLQETETGDRRAL